MPGAASSANGVSNLIQDRVMQIKLPAEGHDDLRRVLTSFVGDSVVDKPFWHNHIEMDQDVRGLAPLTMRFVAAKVPSNFIPTDDQDKVRHAIWGGLSPLLSSSELSRAPPTIMFDEIQTEHGHRAGTIDLTFSAAEHLEKVLLPLRDIRVEFSGGEALHYKYRSCSNTVPSRVLVFECLRLPIDRTNAQAILDALKELMEPVGVVLGLSKVISESKRLRIEASFTGTTRGYLQLNDESMALPWKDLCEKIPKQLIWDGSAYNVFHAGGKQSNKSSFSPAAGASQEAPNSKAHQKRSQTEEGEAEETAGSSNTAKKQKRSEEEDA